MSRRPQTRRSDTARSAAPLLDPTFEENSELLLDQLRTQNVALEQLRFALDVEDGRDVGSQYAASVG